MDKEQIDSKRDGGSEKEKKSSGKQRKDIEMTAQKRKPHRDGSAETIDMDKVLLDGKQTD